MNPLKSHERALRFGREHLHLETGFVHEENGFISLYHNFCYALALLRSYQRESLEEAKVLLGRLLAFQREGFPLWLHRFPQESWESSFNCLLPIYWIQKHFSKFLSAELKADLEKAFQKLCTFCQKTPAAPHLRIKYQAVVQERPSEIEASCAEAWGHYLLAAELFDEERIFAKSLETWDFSLRTYAGQALNEYYVQGQPAPTLLDLAIAHRLGIQDARIYREGPLLLSGALLFSEKRELEMPFKRNRFFVGGTAQKEKGWHLFRYLWGASDKIFSFACQERHLTLEVCENHLLLIYPEEYAEEKSLELKFFCGPREAIVPRVNGRAATLFYLGDSLTFETPRSSLSIRFELIEGEGKFSGHIYPSNRPSEVSPEADAQKSAYDWCIGVRTLVRGKSAIFKIQFEELERASASLEANAGLSTATPIA